MEKRLIEEDYKKLLQIRFDDPEIKYVKSELQPISKNKEGFMGMHLKLIITFSKDGIENVENFFVKSKPFEVSDNHPVNVDNIYEKEMFIYGFLLKEFEKLGYESNFSPKCYLCLNEDTLIMEEMVEKGFQIPGRQTYYDITKMKCLLKSLALLHAGSFCYGKSESIQYDKQYSLPLKEVLFTQYMSGEGFGFNFFKISIESFNILIDLLPKDKEHKSKFKQLLRKAEFGKIFVENHKYKKTVIHGDLWSNNMLFKAVNNITESCCLVDYQCCRYFYPAFDVLLATHHNSSKEFCDNSLQNMYDYYYETFCETVRKYGYDPEEFLPLEDFKNSLELCKMDAMLQVAAVNSTIFISPEFLEEHINKHKLGTKRDDMSLEDQMKEFQMNFSSIAFKNNEIFRKNIIKNLHDLYVALQQKYF